MGYVEERAQAEWALSQERVDRSATFPPAAAHLKAAREARGFVKQAGTWCRKPADLGSLVVAADDEATVPVAPTYD